MTGRRQQSDPGPPQRPPECRVVTQDRRLEVLEGVVGIDAQFLRQPPADPGVALQRVRLPSAPVQREHELPE